MDKSYILFFIGKKSQNLFKEKSSLFILFPYERKQSGIITFDGIPDLGIYFCLPEPGCRCHRPIYVQRNKNVHWFCGTSSTSLKDSQGKRQGIYQIPFTPLFYMWNPYWIGINGPTDRNQIHNSRKGRLHYKPLYPYSSFIVSTCRKEGFKKNLDVCIRRSLGSLPSFNKQ